MCPPHALGREVDGFIMGLEGVDWFLGSGGLEMVLVNNLHGSIPYKKGILQHIPNSRVMSLCLKIDASYVECHIN